MTKKALSDLGVALCTVGGAVFAVGASKEPVSRVLTLPEGAFVSMMVAGGTVAGAGAVAFLFSFLVDRIGQAVEMVTYGDINSKYVCTFAQPGDLPGLHSLYSRHFGGDVPPVDSMRQWVLKCKSAFTLVQRVVHESGLEVQQVLVGSFKVLPLTQAGVRAIDLGQVTGSTLRLQHICADKSRPSGYYVGDVVATTRFARAVVMAHLNAALSDKSSSIYARPLTADGLRLMTKHRFVQVRDGVSPPALGVSCKLNVTAGSRRPHRGGARRLHPS